MQKFLKHLIFFLLLKLRYVFLDISKVFDKIWHKYLLYKFKSMSVSGELYNLPENCLLRRFQSVILNRQTSSWRPHHVSTSQSSIPLPLFFSSISVTLLAIFNLTQNSLGMTHLFLLLLRIRMKILIFSTMVYC